MKIARRLVRLVELFEGWTPPAGWVVSVCYMMGRKSRVHLWITSTESDTSFKAEIRPEMTRQDVVYLMGWIDCMCLRQFPGIEDSELLKRAAEDFETALCPGA